jgi:GWxTD domain-containing protein
MLSESHSYLNPMTTIKIIISKLSKSKGIFLALLGAMFLLSGCSSTRMDNVERNAGYEYRPGYPELRVASIGLVDEFTDSTFITIDADIVYASLVFKKIEEEFQAEILIDVQILSQSDPDNIIQVQNFPITIRDESQRLVTSQNEYLFSEKFSVDPGSYIVNISVTDIATNKQTVRSIETFIPDPFEPVPNITNIQITAKELKESELFYPVTTYDVSNSSDSVRFVFQVTNNDSDDPITIDTRLIKFEADTTIARPMSYPNYTTSNIAFKGIEYDEYEVINSSRRVINQSGSVTIEFIFPSLERGNYRFEVNTDREINDGEELFKARDFSVKSKNYPSLRTPRELAAPLAYLMGKDEYEELMNIEDDVQLKKAIDRFWLSNIKNSKIAQNVIELYYERVEEANKQFANYKEGWKTDMGMIYILFGPPWYTFTSLDETQWSYSHNLYEFESNFFFVAPKIKNKFFPFTNNLLSRTQQYYQVEYQQIQLWLSGTILRDNL